MTAPTPMMIPSIVRTVLNLLRARARSATRITSLGFIVLSRLFRYPDSSWPTAASETGRTPAGRCYALRLLRNYQHVSFVEISLKQLGIVVVGDPALHRNGNQVTLVRSQLPYDLP